VKNDVRSGDEAFTLVEALVSLFVFALLSAGCVLMLTQTIRAQELAGAAQERLREVQMTQALLTADLAQTALRTVRSGEGQILPPFSGGVDQQLMAFVRTGVDPDASAGARSQLTFVEYVVHDDSVVRRTRTAIDPRSVAPVSERVVLRDVREVQVRFYNGQTWEPKWLGATGRPRAIALEATSARYGKVRIASLVSPP